MYPIHPYYHVPSLISSNENVFDGNYLIIQASITPPPPPICPPTHPSIHPSCLILRIFSFSALLSYSCPLFFLLLLLPLLIPCSLSCKCIGLCYPWISFFLHSLSNCFLQQLVNISSTEWLYNFVVILVWFALISCLSFLGSGSTQVFFLSTHILWWVSDSSRTVLVIG